MCARILQIIVIFTVSYLDQQSDGTTLVHLQDLTVLGPHQDVAVAQRYGTYGWVVFQQQPCTSSELYVAQSQRP